MSIGVISPSSGGSSSGLVSANFDAFGRLRVSSPFTLFDSKLVYDAQPLYWDESQTGGAPAGVWDPVNARVTLVAQPNQTSLRQTRRYFNYQPGKSQSIMMTFCMGAYVAGGVSRAGYYDDLDGILFERVGNALFFVRRSSSGTPTATVPQASWNLDPLDGSGPSGVSLNTTETQILVIDLEWLGVGSVRLGFVINGQIIYAHRFDNANLSPYVYMRTPNLPLRYEVDATAAAGPMSFDCICGTVISEGGVQGTGTHYGYPMPALTGNVGNGDTKTLISMRHQGAYPRVTIIPLSIATLARSNGATSWELVYNPTFPQTAPTWAAASYGFCDLDIVGEAVGGLVLASGVFSQNSPAPVLDLEQTTLTLGANVAGVSDIISLRVRNLSGGNETYLGAINWLALT